MTIMDSLRPEPPVERPVKPALKDGWHGKCPQCHQGRIFDGYLKVHDECAFCGEEFHHHRADDGPAYLTILICGHIIGFLMHLAFVSFRPDPIVLGVTFGLIFIAMALYLLPRLKGGFIAYQWAKRMHGFAGPQG